MLHNAAYRELGIPWVYGRHDVVESRLAEVLANTTAADVGFSLTMPLKETALRLSDAFTVRAQRVGGANTLVRRDGQWIADNTDVDGVVAAVQSALAPGATPKSLTILGAGATARAVAVAAADLGVSNVVVAARREAPAKALAAIVSADGIKVSTVDWAKAGEHLASDVVISTVTAGAADWLHAAVPSSPGMLLDVIYAPWPTVLAAAWEARGGVVVPGTRMLLHQAARQIFLMTGVEGPVHSMRAALESVGAAI